MKNALTFKSLLITLTLVLIFVTGTKGQDTVRANEGKAVIKMKIKDSSGKERTIDTTFIITDRESRAAFEEAMKEYQLAADEVAESLKEIEVMVDLPEMEGLNDSLTKVIRVYGHGQRVPEFRWHDRDGSYDYHFDCQSAHAYPNSMIWKSRDGEESLEDLIGDVPLDRVISYSVKNRKGIKRIIIEVEDIPSEFEEQKDVIIIRKKL